MRRSFGGADELGGFEAVEEQPVELLEALSAALHDVAELIALACVAPVVLAAERQQRAARARASTTRRAA